MTNNLRYLVFLLLIGCNSIEPQTESRIEKEKFQVNTDTLVRHKYMTDTELKTYANLILNDSIRPSDNNETFQLLDSLHSRNKSARSYYFSVFQNIAKKSDGALSEVMGKYAQKYMEEYPDEFFDRFNCCDTLKSCCENLIHIAHLVQYEIGMQDDIESAYSSFLDKIEKSNRNYPNDQLMILFIDNLSNGMDEYIEK